MPLEIVGAGLGRTGTASLKMALEKLGVGRCYHMSEVLADPDHMGLWIDAAEGRADYDRIFADFTATVDFPAAIYWRELITHYPDAKVILSLRDPEKWYRSTQETILGPRWWEFVQSGPFGAMCRATIERFFDGDIRTREHMIESFNRHTDAVKKGVPADRLLVFEASQGWPPLCEFLGLPAPVEPYPYANSEEETKELLEAIMAAAEDKPVGAEADDHANKKFSPGTG